MAFLICFAFSCKQDVIDSDKAASLIYDGFELEEDDKLEIIEFSLESPETALVIFRLNGNQLSSRIKKTDVDWLMSEIQNKEDEWIPAEYFLIIKGKLIDIKDKAFVNQLVTLFELISEEGKLKTTIVFDKGIFLNPYTHTDSEGRFTIIADRRFWEESGMFTLGVSYLDRTVHLRNPNNIIISVEVDKNTKHVDLGEIRVRY